MSLISISITQSFRSVISFKKIFFKYKCNRHIHGHNPESSWHKRMPRWWSILNPVVEFCSGQCLLVTCNIFPCHAQCYADELVLKIDGKFHGALASTMYEGPQQLEHWWKRDNHRVNHSTTAIVPFTCKRKNLGAFCNLIINGECISTSNMANYLDLNHNHIKLTWNVQHTNTLQKSWWSLMTTALTTSNHL